MEAGEILLKRGLLDRQQLDRSRNQANGHCDGLRLIESAVQLGYCSEEQALRAVGDAVGIDYIDLNGIDVDLSLLKGFPHKLIHRQTIFPISRNQGQLVVATSDPFDLYPLDEVSAATGLSVLPVLAGRADISRLIKRYLGVGSETVDGLIAAQSSDEDDAVELLSDIETDGSELSEMAQEASVVRLVNEILMEAIDARASDVHIESQPSGVVVRYRIDG
ncbi:MAG: GspE/PulE family protein, partial [Woeseiaceae bacterium]